MGHCTLNVTLSNDWIKVTYPQVHGFPVFKTVSFKSLNWVCLTAFPQFIQFGKDQRHRRHRTFQSENLVFH